MADRKSLFEYCVIHNPEDDESKPRIIVDVTRVLARNENEVSIIAARSIPEDYIHRLEEVDIIVRPF